jgi:nucleoside-diphosphate-sugar epimerase
VSATVVITGASGPLGRRVVALVAADPEVERVVAIDRPGHPPAAVPSTRVTPPITIEQVALDLTDPELKTWMEGATAVIHLGVSAGEDHHAEALDGTGRVAGDLAGERALLAACADAGVATVVVLSSALVYGAWPNNPVPLTEDAPLRPDAALPFVIERAEIERLAGELRDDQVDHPDGPVHVAVLRPTITVDASSGPWLARSPWSTVGVQIHDADPPVQFLHMDDLAAAIDLARRERLDGPFNVAPDGWIPPDQRKALAAPAPRVRLPAPVAERLAAFRWKVGLARTPPAVLAYTMHPWVISNDRLTAAGWHPAHSNEEAFVEADDGGPLANLNPKRRQFLALGAVGAVAAALVAGAVVVVRRRRRTR